MCWEYMDMCVCKNKCVCRCVQHTVQPQTVLHQCLLHMLGMPTHQNVVRVMGMFLVSWHQHPWHADISESYQTDWECSWSADINKLGMPTYQNLIRLMGMFLVSWCQHPWHADISESYQTDGNVPGQLMSTSMACRHIRILSDWWECSWPADVNILGMPTYQNLIRLMGMFLVSWRQYPWHADISESCKTDRNVPGQLMSTSMACRHIRILSDWLECSWTADVNILGMPTNQNLIRLMGMFLVSWRQYPWHDDISESCQTDGNVPGQLMSASMACWHIRILSDWWECSWPADVNILDM